MISRALPVLAAFATLISPVAVQAQVVLNNGGAFDLRVVSYRDIPYRTVVRQQYDFSCGSAALATLLRHHYGRDVTEAQVFESMFASGDQAQIKQVGFSLLDMRRYLETYGYQGDGFRLTLDELGDSHSPAILMVDHNGYRHFVVFKGIDADRVLIGDPALGLKIYSRAEFTAMWNGVAFMIRDQSDRFNQDGEWKPWASAPLTDAMPVGSLGALTRDLPPLYQISTTVSLDSYLR